MPHGLLAVRTMVAIAALTLPITALSSVMGMNVILNDSTTGAPSGRCWR